MLTDPSGNDCLHAKSITGVHQTHKLNSNLKACSTGLFYVLYSS